MAEAGLVAAARLLLRWHRERLAAAGRMDMQHQEKGADTPKG